jgi:hypothetical protein
MLSSFFFIIAWVCLINLGDVWALHWDPKEMWKTYKYRMLLVVHMHKFIPGRFSQAGALRVLPAAIAIKGTNLLDSAMDPLFFLPNGSFPLDRKYDSRLDHGRSKQ